MTPIERAARALALITYTDGNIDDLWEGYVPDVIAVLSAIREPSEAMVEAGTGLRMERYTNATGLEIVRADAAFMHPKMVEDWQAMIDAMLAEAT